jgi:hypothetical protein
METILRMLFPLLDPHTSVWIVIMTMATAAAFAVLVALARRWQSYWWVSFALVATALASMALASSLALRVILATFEDVLRNGGGIGAISFGIWQATSLPLTAAWIGIVAGFIGILFLMPFVKNRQTPGRHPRPFLFVFLMASVVAAGIVPAVTFQRAISYVLPAITPGTALAPASVTSHLLTAETMSAVLLVVAIALVITLVLLARRFASSEIVSYIAMFALLVTVGVSAFLAASLHATSTHFRTIAREGVKAAVIRR